MFDTMATHFKGKIDIFTLPLLLVTCVCLILFQLQCDVGLLDFDVSLSSLTKSIPHSTLTNTNIEWEIRARTTRNSTEERLNVCGLIRNVVYQNQ